MAKFDLVMWLDGPEKKVHEKTKVGVRMTKHVLDVLDFDC